MSLDLFFSADLIPNDLQLTQDLHIRPLASTDYARNHLAVLSVLTLVTDPGEQAWSAQFHAMRAAPNTYYPLAIVHTPSDQIVALGTLLIERKFLRGLATVGHIEDIAVDTRHQGQKLGLRVVQALTHISEAAGCYKTILNCNEDNVPFYRKCGFEKKECEMARYAPDPSPRL